MLFLDKMILIKRFMFERGPLAIQRTDCMFSVQFFFIEGVKWKNIKQQKHFNPQKVKPSEITQQ